MSATIIRGDARSLPLADESVDLVVTSPPYFGLRSYTDGGEHYAGQLGSEPTPAEFVEALLDCTREMVRVLKPTGSIWVNLGDKYAGSPSGPRTLSGDRSYSETRMPRQMATVPAKSLIGIPWRYALRCIDDLGLILRAEVIWSKPNGLPESVTDRVRRSHETWFHFTREPRYYSAVDEIREAHSTVVPGQKSTGGSGYDRTASGSMNGSAHALGKLPGSMWEIPTQPLIVPEHLGVDHFAAFPMEWPRRIIRGWSPSGICTACGEGRRPVAERTRDVFYGNGRHRSGAQQVKDGAAERGWVMDEKWRATTTITGEACACPEPTAPTRPSVVLDPFGGTGTTALVADVLGRHGISVDMSADYCRLAEWRTTDPGERARALQVEKPPAVLDGQLDLLDLIAEVPA